jgi:Flp pilus assembly protein TadD
VAYVHNNLGVAYERLGRTEEAQAAYATATQLSPRYVKARVNSNRMGKVASLGVVAEDTGQ